MVVSDWLQLTELVELRLKFISINKQILVLFVQHLRQVGVVGKFVEFFGPGVEELSLADRATISNMCPEYGATIGFFPVDDTALLYLRQSSKHHSIYATIAALFYFLS